MIAFFPSGAIATSKTLLGNAEEAEWNLFTAKMARKSGATIVPIYFSGQSSRIYQMASLFSFTIRQALFIHEVARSLNKPQTAVIGSPISPEEIANWQGTPRQLVDYLRKHTLALKET